MDLELSGKIALVTGGGQHIGAAICRALAAEGAAVAVNDLREERAQAVADDIVGRGGRAIAVAADVTDGEQVQRMVQRASSELGPITILVNNAGIHPKGTAGTNLKFMESSRENWAADIELIQFGVLNLCHAVLPGMCDAGGGKIVNVISDAGKVGEPRLSTYSMAKGGVAAFSKALAKEVGRDRINVNCVSPGATPNRPDMSFDDPRTQQIARNYPIARGLGRLGIPDDIAGMVAFLVSPRADFITGQHISVSGGYSMVG